MRESHHPALEIARQIIISAQSGDLVIDDLDVVGVIIPATPDSQLSENKWVLATSDMNYRPLYPHNEEVLEQIFDTQYQASKEQRQQQAAIIEEELKSPYPPQTMADCNFPPLINATCSKEVLVAIPQGSNRAKVIELEDSLSIAISWGSHSQIPPQLFASLPHSPRAQDLMPSLMSLHSLDFHRPYLEEALQCASLQDQIVDHSILMQNFSDFISRDHQTPLKVHHQFHPQSRGTQIIHTHLSIAALPADCKLPHSYKHRR